MAKELSAEAAGRAGAGAARGAGLGTFGGVFTPSILTILGVIMYLRFGWVVGNVGLTGALVIVTICTAVTFLTALSMSSIATDRRVGTGGAYYMISRSLGVETGGAVGLPLYMALSLSAALYAIGFAESAVAVFAFLDARWVGVVTIVLVSLLAVRSAGLVIRAQYVIMAVIGLSLLSFVLGGPLAEPAAEAPGSSPSLRRVGFWAVLAVFFPAVTGIEAGVNMSGDLRDPARSIPRGTMAALLVSYIVYMTLPVLLAGRADEATLLSDPLVMRRIAFWGDAILLGVWGATLSSAMGSMLGAPRVLQAMARDRVLPRPLRFLGKGTGAEDTPRVGTVVTLGIALAAIVLGDLNVVAPILTMFFLTSYLTVNTAAAVEAFLGHPSYRPVFRVHWSFSALGAALCLMVMFLINAAATVLAALVVVGIFTWLQRRELRTAWGDVRRGLWIALLRLGLLRLGTRSHPRNWRPHPLVLSGAPTRRWNLIELANSLTHGRGLMTVASVLPRGFRTDAEQMRMEERIRAFLTRRGVHAFVRLVGAPDAFDGAERLIDAYGYGPLVPNTVLLGDSENAASQEQYCAMVMNFHRSQRSVVILREARGGGFGARRRIDVWWGGLQGNGGLMLVLAYLLGTSREWRGAEVRLKLVVREESAAGRVRANLAALVERWRLRDMAIDVLVSGGRPFPEILHASSWDADLVILGMARPDERFAEYYQRQHAYTAGLPTTLFVLAADDVGFAEVFTGR